MSIICVILNPLLLLVALQIFFDATIQAAPSKWLNRQKENTTIDERTIANSSNPKAKSNLKWTSRNAWQAAPTLHTPTRITAAVGGVSHVIIHHTATPAGACRQSTNAFAATIRAIQRAHQQQRGWDDIGYNFLIGGSDERADIYEGRGFGIVGAHAVGYNARSVGIALIGNWTADLPPSTVLEKLQELITYGVQMGHIQRNYVLLGHRQVKATDCPGNRLYNELKEWPHYEQQGA